MLGGAQIAVNVDGDGDEALLQKQAFIMVMITQREPANHGIQWMGIHIQ